MSEIPVHSKFGASKAHRWLNCAGSAEAEHQAEANYPASIFAEEGREIHAIAEKVLRGEAPPADTKAEYLDIISEYGSVIKSIIGQDKVYWMKVEQRFHLDKLHPELYGTADCVIIKGDTMHVVDLKTGAGVPVYASTFNPDGTRIPNIQLAYYGLGAYLAVDPEIRRHVSKIRLYVVQPRLQFAASECEISTFDLSEVASELLAGIARASVPDAPRKTGYWCKFCKAAVNCYALKETAQEATKLAFDDLGKPHAEPQSVSDLENDWDGNYMGDLYWKIQILKTFVREVERVTVSALKQGKAVKGLKLVHAKGRRTYVDAEKALQTLQVFVDNEENLYDKKLRSPAQMEKFLREQQVTNPRGLVNSLAHSPPGKPTIAPEQDPRPALATSDLFKGVTTEDDED